jgi:tetratricopeptide (TPR) repeat protein
MAVTLPLVLLLLDYWSGRKRDRMFLFDKIPYFALSLFLGIVAIISISRAGMIRHDGQYSLFNSLSVAFYGVGFYLNKIILPIKLSCFYPLYGIKNTFVNLYSFFVMAILIYGVILSGKYTKKIILGTAFFFITLIPALQLIPNGEIIVADRYVYISAIGIFYFISEGFFWLYSRKTKYLGVLSALVLVVLIGLTGSLMASTWGRCGVWKDSLSLWNDALANYPNAITPYINRGQYFFYNNEYDKALPDSICAMYLSYKYGRGAKHRRYFLILGNLYRAKGRNAEAAMIFENMIKFNPRDDEAYFNLANINDEIFLNKKKAAELYRKAIEINPNHASARYYLKKIE